MNAVNWFEIPVADFDRAYHFYSQLFDSPLHKETMGGAQMGFFTHSQGGVGGAICKGEDYVPSTHGVLVYLSAGENLNEPLEKVEQMGGKVLLPKTLITKDIGYMALILDTEGNKIALHSPH